MRNTAGSCLLLLTLISSIIFIFAINSWQTILLNSDLVLKKHNYEFNFRILEGLHNFGIFKCINNYRKISKKNSNNGTIQSIVLYNGPWPLESAAESIKMTNMTLYNSIIILTINEEFSVINSRLVNSATGEKYSMESKLKKIIKPHILSGAGSEVEGELNGTQKTRFLFYDWQF